MLGIGSGNKNFDVYDLRTAELVTSHQSKKGFENVNFDLSGSALVYQEGKNLSFVKVLDEKLDEIQQYTQKDDYRT
jgi:hypothetical protein